MIQSRITEQVRPHFPFPLEEPHPRAAEMARVMGEIIARDGGVTYAEIQQHGFTTEEIIEFEVSAKAILREGVRVPPADAVPHVTEKAIDAVASRMPVMADNPPTPEQRKLWSTYCLARAALKLDPWTAQLRRCEAVLLDFLRTLPMLESERERVRATVAMHLANRWRGAA